MSSTTLDASALARATPPTRDRYVDLLRVGSLAVVILGHWLMAVPIAAADGTVRVTNVLALVPALRPLTWLLQVMPVFFLVGGYAQAKTLSRSGSYASFIRSRTSRLLRPAAVFAAVWLALGTAAGLAGLDHDGLIRLALRTVAQPLWFLGVYLGVVALAPAMWGLHRRLGRRAVAVPIGLLAATALVDVARFAGGHSSLAYLNLLFVWVGAHQLGFFYADGSLQRFAGRLAGGGLAALIVLTTVGPYPVSMVGVPGEAVSNMSPPTLALAACAVWLTGLVLLVRGPANRWLARARVWRVVVIGNLLTMTAFLWHLTAAFVVIGGALAFGGGLGAPAATAQWWAQRPLWLVAYGLVTAGLVAVFRRFDAPRSVDASRPRTRGRDVAAAFGGGLCALGVLGLSGAGFAGLLDGHQGRLLVVSLTAPMALALIAAGALLTAPPRLARPTW
jgi:fucose 4-O-acetylase-like acetyltransferase